MFNWLQENLINYKLGIKKAIKKKNPKINFNFGFIICFRKI